MGVEGCSAKPFSPHCSPSAKAPAPFTSCFLGFSSAVAALGSREG